MLYRYKKFSVVSSLQYVFKGFKKENNKNLNKEQDDKHIPVDDITKQIFEECELPGTAQINFPALFIFLKLLLDL